MENISGKWEKNQGIKVEFYGSIYNRDSINTNKSLSDNELIEFLYTTKGYESFGTLDGAFLIMIKDGESTIVARDRHAIGSQLYYNEKCYANSLELLQKIDSNNYVANKEAIVEFMMRGYIAPQRSSFLNVNKLGAGEVLIYKGGKFERFKLQGKSIRIDTSRIKSIDDASQYYKELHQNAIKRRIDGASSVGLLLSGGYDSGSNLSALREIYTGELSSFTVGFKGDSWSEKPLARILSNHFGTTHHEYDIDGSEIENLPSIIKHLGDPFVEGGLMVNYAAMKMVNQNRTDVIIGGDGSDQYFGTSGRELALHHLLAKSKLKPLAKGVFGMLSNNKVDNNNTLYKIRFHLNKVLDVLEGDNFGFQPYQLKKMIIGGFKNPLIYTMNDNSSFNNIYEQHRLLSDIDKIINQVILFKASRMAEMFENKMVFPFMDLNLYHLLKIVPREYKCKVDGGLLGAARGHLTSKYLLKKAYKESLPKEITERKKQGGFAPMPIFFNDAKRRKRIKEFILSSSICGELLDKTAVGHFITNYENTYGDSTIWFWHHQNSAIQYFNLLTLAIWWEIFVIGRNIEKLDL